MNAFYISKKNIHISPTGLSQIENYKSQSLSFLHYTVKYKYI